jgi:hypothetical protein
VLNCIERGLNPLKVVIGEGGNAPQQFVTIDRR